MTIFNRHQITLHDAKNQTTENYATCLDLYFDGAGTHVKLDHLKTPEQATLTDKDIGFLNCLIMRSTVKPNVQLNLNAGDNALSDYFLIKTESERIASVHAFAKNKEITEDANIKVFNILKPIRFEKEVETGYQINGDEMMLVWDVNNIPTLKGQRYTVSIARGESINCNQ